MKYWLSPYSLQKKMGGEVFGYLLKSESDGLVGYADIFPWVQFGDTKYDKIPDELKSGKLSPLVEKSVEFSRKNAKARSEEEGESKELSFTNHGLVIQEPEKWIPAIEKLLSDDFRRIKIKVGKNLNEEARYLLKLKDIWPNEPWIRLDFNGNGSQKIFQQLSEIKDLVDFVEDPFADPSDWQEGAWRWAFDHPGFEAKQVDHSIRLVKPAKMQTPKTDKPLVFTSYMDHPVGIAHAMIQASESGVQSLDYGFLSLSLYENTAYHELFKIKDSKLTLASGMNSGFTELLESQKWVPVGE